MIEELLKYQTEEGFFPTYRSKKGERIIESDSNIINNIGIHTFILQKLIELFPDNEQVRCAFSKGLDFLLKDAIHSGGKYLWRWLKEPTRSDYLYPFDYDDTLRARYIIEIAKKNGFDIPEKFKSFDYDNFLLEGMTSNGIFTFVGKKLGNTVCPVVNMNILSAYNLYLKSENIENNNIFGKIKGYIEGVIESEDFQLSNFSILSKFYLSHSLFAYLISEEKYIFEEETLDKVDKRIEKEKGNYRNPLEASWATSTLINLDGDKYLIEKGIEYIQNSKGDSLWSPQPFYQHQRLGNVFGSKVQTSIFCMESIAKVVNGE